MSLRRLRGLAEVCFDLLLLDVWGVLHDGERAYPEVHETLIRLRDAGRRVLLVSNASWREERVIRHLESMGISRQLHRGAVTAGDVTRDILASGVPGLGRRYWFAGSHENRCLLANLRYRLVSDHEAADFVLLTDRPEAGSVVMDRALACGLPLVCANPDALAPAGTRSLECAGAIAADYRARGGQVLMMGKPHRAIFAAALSREPARAPLVCGDGIETDLAGARAAGLPSVWVTRGAADPARSAAMRERSQIKPLGLLTALLF